MRVVDGLDELEALVGTRSWDQRMVDRDAGDGQHVLRGDRETISGFTLTLSESRRELPFGGSGCPRAPDAVA